ncbi:type II toxin-antitoxin system VapC family toxin [Deinococcus sp.]|uniref:type II toxin-antitoxin system VapC family toxin n=1 Tax=Deinococcus sp. TaxID=47478 RepID=UPI003B5C7508
MSLALDSNILLALWKNEATAEAIEAAIRQEELWVCGAVVGELMPYAPDAESLLTQMNVRIDWHLNRAIWLRAGSAYTSYVQRRRRNKSSAASFGTARRILTDHLIGAHAATLGVPLLSLNAGDYSDFTELMVVAP